MSSANASEVSFLRVGNPYFNYQRIVSKFFVPYYLKDYFGFGRRKVIRTFASVCHQEKLTVSQVYSAYVRLFYLSAQHFTIPRKLVNHDHRLIVESFDYSVPVISGLISTKFEMMKKHCHSIIQEVRDQENSFNNQISSLQQQLIDNNNASKELELLKYHFSCLEQENEQIKKVNIELQNNCDSFILQHQQKEESIKVLRSTLKDKEDEIKDCYSRFSELQNEMDSLKQQQQSFEVDIQKERDVIIHLKQQRDDITNQVVSIEKEKLELEKSRIDLSKQCTFNQNTINQLKKNNDELKQRVKRFQDNSSNRKQSLGYASLDPHDVDNIAKEFNKLLLSEEVSTYRLFLKRLQINSNFLKVLKLHKKGKDAIFHKGSKRFREYLQSSIKKPGCTIYDLLINTHHYICEQCDSEDDMDVTLESYYN